MVVTLYHNAMSSCSQKVRLALEEKSVFWTSSEINMLAREHKSDDYLKINPAGEVPALKVVDRIITESSIINEFVNDAFDGPALMPADALNRAIARLWIKKVDDSIHSASGIITYATVMRIMMMAMPRDEVLAEIAKTSDTHTREVRRSIYQHGVEAAEFQGALDELLVYFESINRALASSTWLAGEAFTLADCCALPYVLRFEHFGLSAIWNNGRMPHVERWLDAIKTRSSFKNAIRKWVPDQALAMLAMAGTQLIAKIKMS